MPDLTEGPFAELHQALLALRDELRQQLEDSNDGAQPVSLETPIGRLARMDALQQQSMVQATRRTAENRLARVEAALRRYRHNEYGLCMGCEEEIGLARLKARPEAAFCVACQNHREARPR